MIDCTEKKETFDSHSSFHRKHFVKIHSLELNFSFLFLDHKNGTLLMIDCTEKKETFDSNERFFEDIL